jgi:AraC family transcriptional regulator
LQRLLAVGRQFDQNAPSGSAKIKLSLSSFFPFEALNDFAACSQEIVMTTQSEGAPVAPAARRVRRAVTLPGLHAYEAAYDPLSQLPEHGHSSPFFTYVLRGSYVERAGRLARRCFRGAVIFHDHESHTNEVGPDGTSSFNVELDPEHWRELNDGIGIVTAMAGRVLGGDVEWPALRVWHEFQQPDTARALGMEEAIVLLYEATRHAYVRGLFEPHQRLDRCVAYLDAHLMEVHRLAGVARIAGVHPMYLAKLFRRRFACSMGEYLRRRRVAWACEQLARKGETITDIALNAGFADHAHFTRTFVRVTGCTPRWYRAQVTNR